MGVGIPGVVGHATGLVKNANSTWLNGRPLHTDLEARLDRPVRLANDANCFALSEAIDGAAEVLTVALDLSAERDARAGRASARGTPVLTEAGFDALVAHIHGIARDARDSGLATGFHPHGGTFIETPDEIRRLAGRLDPALVGICLDVGHVIVGGGDPVDMLDELGERLPRSLAARAGTARADLNLVAGRLRRGLIDQRIARLGEQLAAAWKVAELSHPDRPLARGYARVTTRDGATLTTSARAREARLLTLRFADGSIEVAAGDAASKAPLERRPRPTYSAPQPGLFDPEEG